MLNPPVVAAHQTADMETGDLTAEERATLAAIQSRKKAVVLAHRQKKGAANNQAVLPRRADSARTSTAVNMKVRSCILSFTEWRTAVSARTHDSPCTCDSRNQL